MTQLRPLAVKGCSLPVMSVFLLANSHVLCTSKLLAGNADVTDATEQFTWQPNSGQLKKPTPTEAITGEKEF